MSTDLNELAKRVRDCVRDTSGESSRSEREDAAAVVRAIVDGRAAVAGSLSDGELAMLKDLATSPVDLDPRSLLEAGASQDRLFELILNGAVERGTLYLESGMSALQKALEETE